MAVDLSLELRDFLVACQVSPDRLEGGCLRMAHLLELLRTANQRHNLTRITESDDFWCKHVADSLTLAAACPEVAVAPLRVADVGCGAGFPLLPLAAFFPHLKLFGIEATAKKVEFVAMAARELRLDNLTIVHGRARELAAQAEWQGGFDLAVARAVGEAGRLLREARRLLAPARDSRLILYKTPEAIDREAGGLQRECEKHKMTWHRSPTFELPGQGGRRQFAIIGRA